MENNILLCSDNEFNPEVTYQYFWKETENLDHTYFTDYFVSKCYLPEFPFEGELKPAATDEFFRITNSKHPLWTIFQGHGNPEVLASENFLKTDDVSRFSNNSTPTIFFAFSCKNGSYTTPFKEFICKQYLFKETGGCINYIGTPLNDYLSQTSKLGISIFETLKSNPSWSTGKIIYSAKKELIRKRNYFNFALLGDSALVISNQNVSLKISIEKSTIQKPSSITCTVLSAESFQGRYYCKFLQEDSISLDNGGPIVNFTKDTIIKTLENNFTEFFNVAIPKDFQSNKKFKFIAYVKNDVNEGRVDTPIIFLTAIISNLLKLSKNIL